MLPIFSARRASASEAPEFLPGIQGILEERPGPLVWAVPATITALTLIAIIWLWASEIDVVSPTQGKLIPNNQLQTIQPEHTSTIEKILVREGQTVVSGQPLIELRSREYRAESQRLEQELHSASARRLRLEALTTFSADQSLLTLTSETLPPDYLQREQRLFEDIISSHQSELTALESRLNSAREKQATLQAEVQRLEQLLPFARARAERAAALAGQGLISRDDLDRAKEEQVAREQELLVKRAELAEAKREIATANAERKLTEDRFRRDAMDQLVETERQLNSLTAELAKAQFQLDSRQLKAPMDGIVTNLAVSTVGGVVQSGQVLMNIVPKDSPLQVEAKVLNRDVGFIRPGQPVKVKLDSFPFTKYGHIEGTVRSVDLAPISDEKLGDVYPTVIELARNEIFANGDWITLVPGMTCTVDIKTGERRLIDYLISPFLRYQDEALRER